MADYYPLLARALDALPDRTPAMRKAVYERARNALIGQLRSLEPPLAESDIELERNALDHAIARLETDYGAPPAEPVPAPPTPVVVATPPAPIPEPSPPEPAPEAALPPAPAPSFLPTRETVAPFPDPLPPDAAPREAAVAITAPRKAFEPTPPEPASPADPDLPAEAIAVDPDAAGARKRPRIEVVAPGGSRSRTLRNAFVGTVLAAVIAAIAVAAFLLRDKPATLQQNPAETAETQGADRNDAKYADRVGGGEAPARERPAAGIAGGAPGEARGASPPAQAELAVAQRAVLIEENTAAPNTAPTTLAGRVLWRLESVSGEQGQPLETAVVATVTVPDAGLSLVMTLQRNLDATLPASHTISLAFSATGPGGQGRSVQDVGLLQAKDDENGRGAPVSGLPVRVRENLFLIGLSSLRNDVDRNTDLLLHKPWFDIAVRYAGGQRAVLVFETGNAGAQALRSAFEQWR